MTSAAGTCGTLFDDFAAYQICDDLSGCVVTLNNPGDATKGGSCEAVCQSQMGTSCTRTATVNNWCLIANSGWNAQSACSTARSDDYMPVQILQIFCRAPCSCSD